ncbi:uncharacterized protein LOC120191220 isoform X2 [Hibiscus syriacus]|uniref:uncharacterized protein LOC120191220 isoform X2 n=1 Tax=Hibiscus syriacus TaxID=106335 RepID=UPI0019249C18|nr:uncharacterized protein LOC120191220 isoform X2 [Hibiscus syriacus]
MKAKHRNWSSHGSEEASSYQSRGFVVHGVVRLPCQNRRIEFGLRITWCMAIGHSDESLILIEPEIERVFRQRRRAQENMYYIANQGIGQEGDQNVETTPNVGHAARPRVIRDHLNPILDDLNLGIVTLEIRVSHFELKSFMFNMLNSIGQFGGMPNEVARHHIHNFLEGLVEWCSIWFDGVIG